MAFSHPALWLGLTESLIAGWTLGLSALSGFIAAYIFSRMQPAIGEPSLVARQIVGQELRDSAGRR